jgi:hypothetical protein
MSQIRTNDDYFTSKVDDSHLDSVYRDYKLGDTELIGYQHNPEEGTVTCIIDISQIDTNLRYIY